MTLNARLSQMSKELNAFRRRLFPLKLFNDNRTTRACQRQYKQKQTRTYVFRLVAIGPTCSRSCSRY